MRLWNDGSTERDEMQNRKPIFYILTACIGIEVLMLLWLCSLGREAFMQYIWVPDTPTYTRVASELADTFTLISSHRTLGYPLFLALGYLIGGRDYGLYLIIVVQLVLNIGFTWGCWRLLERIVPDAGAGLRAVVTLFFFWASLGMALYLMTDFLAALYFGIFLYGILFWRTPSSVLLSGTSLALATLTRPTFTFFPILLPIAAYLVGRFTSKVPWYHLVAFTGFSVAATGVSVMYQYTTEKYIGPSPMLVNQVVDTLYHGVVAGQVSETDYTAYKKEFEVQVEKRANRRFASLSPSEREHYATQIFREELISHPIEIITQLIKNFIKYLIVPVESNVMRVTAFYLSEQTYGTYVRPILGLLCLPVWCASMMPPVSAPKNQRMYYLLVTVLLIYILGLSATHAGCGERIRFPLLAFMLPLMVWNVHRVHGFLHGLSSEVSRNAAA